MAALQQQAAKFGAKATKAAAAHQMLARAEKLLSGLDEVRQEDRVAKLRFPKPAACGKTPLMASGLSKSYGSLEIFTDVDLAIDRVIAGLEKKSKVMTVEDKTRVAIFCSGDADDVACGLMVDEEASDDDDSAPKPATVF